MRAYENLKFYQNICEIRRLIIKTTNPLRKSHLRLVGQMADAARSAKQNIREGYAKDSAGQFANSIKISRGSLEELRGDVDDCLEDGLIGENIHKQLSHLFEMTFIQIDRYLDSLYRLDKEGKWKTRFKR
ncbi:MAG: four helix bundle protein [Candidatus Omnitrophota bacterium]